MTEMSVTVAENNPAYVYQAELTEELVSRFYRFIDAKPQTAYAYKRAIKPFFIYLRERGISRPSREDVIEYKSILERKVKASTVQSYMASLRLFFRWLSQEGIYKDITDHVKV